MGNRLQSGLFLEQPFSERRSYMAGLGRFLTKVREYELLGGEHPYSYALNNPMSYTDPTGLAPQGLQIPTDSHDWGWMKQKCIGSKEQKRLDDKLKNKACSDAIKKWCKKDFKDIISTVRFRVDPQCGEGVPACTLAPPVPIPIPGLPVVPKCRIPIYICINEHICKGDISKDDLFIGTGFKDFTEARVCMLLFELGNWCGCNAPGANKEVAAFEIERACNCNPVRFS